jgi:ABC-type proline/glycine betaine transport system permease subunit
MMDDIVRQPDVLAQRPGLRLLAVTLWAGFLGAVPMLAVFLFTLPPVWAELLAIGALSKAFFLCWLLALLPAFVAGVLTVRSVRGRVHEH